MGYSQKKFALSSQNTTCKKPKRGKWELQVRCSFQRYLTKFNSIFQKIICRLLSLFRVGRLPGQPSLTIIFVKPKMVLFAFAHLVL